MTAYCPVLHTTHSNEKRNYRRHLGAAPPDGAGETHN